MRPRGLGILFCYGRLLESIRLRSRSGVASLTAELPKGGVEVHEPGAQLLEERAVCECERDAPVLLLDLAVDRVCKHTV